MSALKPTRRLLRSWLARLAAIVLVPRRQPPVASSPTRVLVLRIDERVGNVLLTTPLLRAARELLPHATIEVLVAASKKAIVDGLADVIAFEKRDLFRAPWRFVRTMLALRRARYDVVVDASHWHQLSLSSAMLLAWTRAPLRISHDRAEAHLFATHVVKRPPEGEPEIDSKLRLLEPVGGAHERPGLETRLGTTEASRQQVRAWLAERGLASARLVGLLPGARKADRRSPPEIFAAIGAEAIRLGSRVLVLWGPGEERLAERVAADSGGIMVPPSDLEGLAAWMRACAATVVNDTGPMHLSVATGTATVALFSRGDHRRWGHDRPPHVVIVAEGKGGPEVVAEAGAALKAILSVKAARGPDGGPH